VRRKFFQTNNAHEILPRAEVVKEEVVEPVIERGEESREEERYSRSWRDIVGL
jgi:hypothetical protein